MERYEFANKFRANRFSDLVNFKSEAKYHTFSMVLRQHKISERNAN